MKTQLSLLALLLGLLAFAPASAQQGGLIASGHVIGNGTSGTRTPTDTSITSLFDVALCATNGRAPVRVSGTWQCGTLANMSGNLAVANLNSGTGATSSTFWRGDGTWAAAVTSVTCNGGLTGGAITATGTCAADIATDSNTWSATSSKLVDAAKLNSAGAIVGLTDAATIATDMATGINFSVTLGGNRTLGAPTNTQAGRSGCYFFTQDGTGSRTLAYNAVWKFPSAVAPVLTTTAAAVDMLCYVVKDSTHIYATMTLDMR